MASIDNTPETEVLEGALPDSVIVKPRRHPLSPLRLREPTPADLSVSGWDVNLFGDPVDDNDALPTVALTADTPNGLRRTTNADGKPAVWAEPSPRRFDVWSPGSGALALSAPVGAVNEEHGMGSGQEATVTVTARALPLVVTGVINLNDCLQEEGVNGSQAGSSVRGKITATLSEPAQADVVVSTVRDIFYGQGGSASLVLPAVSVPGVELASYTLRCELVVFYREAVSLAFDVSASSLQVGLQCQEYTSQ